MKATREGVLSPWFNYALQKGLSEKLTKAHQQSYSTDGRGGLGTESRLGCLEVRITVTPGSITVRCDSTFEGDGQEMDFIEIVELAPGHD